MAWTVQDQGEPANDTQSILFQEYLDVLVAGLSGIDCVLDGCAVTTAGTNLTLDVAKGSILSNRVLQPVTAGTVTIGTADATNPRIDLVVANSSGTKAVLAGTAAANPKPPARTANDVVLAVVYVPANDTVITTNQITDQRVFPPRPITIAKVTTNTATNNTTGAITVLSVVLPSGLMNAGSLLRFHVGGTILLNSGTPTITLTIAYGGANLFLDASAASTADADRLSWQLRGHLASEGNADQKLNGHLQISLVGAKTAPTTGRSGDFVATNLNFPFSGALGTVDSNAADRTLLVTWTMNVANAANEVDVEYSHVELC
jgi:hypothetical protein